MGNDLRTRPDRTAAPAPPGSRARVLTLCGFGAAAAGLLAGTLLFGAAAVVLGVTAHRHGDPLGRWAAAAGGVVVLIGLVGLAMLATLRGGEPA